MAGKGGGGAWKVAYADFVTAMMAFFLVMWITAQSKPIKESVAGYFNDPLGGPSTRPNGSSYKRTMENGDAPYTRGKPMIGPGRGRGMSTPSKRKIKHDEDATTTATAARKPPMFFHGGDRSYVGTALLFAEDSSELDKTGRQRLEELIPWIAGKPNKIEIRGHSSGRPTGADSTHRDLWELCFARCAAAMAVLREHGIEPERIRLSQGGAYDRQGLSGDRERPAEQSRVEVFLLNEYVGDLAPEGAEQIEPARTTGNAKQTAGKTPQSGESPAEQAEHSADVHANASTAVDEPDVTTRAPVGHTSSQPETDDDPVEDLDEPATVGKKYQHQDAPAH